MNTQAFWLAVYTVAVMVGPLVIVKWHRIVHFVLHALGLPCL